MILESSRYKSSVLGLHHKHENFDVNKACFAK